MVKGARTSLPPMFSLRLFMDNPLNVAKQAERSVSRLLLKSTSGGTVTLARPKLPTKMLTALLAAK